MSFFSSIGNFISKCSGFISNIVKKGAELFSKIDLSTAYDKIEKIFDFYQKVNSDNHNYATSQRDLGQRVFNAHPALGGRLASQALERLNIDYDSNYPSKGNELSEKVSMHGSEIETIKERVKDLNHIMGLRIDLSRLLNSALMIERASSNAQLHSSNLNIHYQSIRNINGLMMDVNGIRYGLKKIISTFNHNINKINSSGSVDLDKIENIDIDIKQGGVSQIAALDAFDITRDLLLKEIKTIQCLSREHIGEVNVFKSKVAGYGGVFATKVIQILDEDITPRLQVANKLAILLESDLRQLPAPKRNESGRFITKKGDSGIEIEFDSE